MGPSRFSGFMEPTGASSQFESGESFQLVQEANRRLLFDLLDSFDGSKGIIWLDKELMKRFNSLVSPDELRQHGVHRMFESLPPVDAGVEHLLYLTQPSLDKVKLVARNIASDGREAGRRHHVLFVPRGSVLCEQRLKEANLGDKLSSIKDLEVSLFVLETDLASLERPSLVADVLLRDDWSPLRDVALAIDSLETTLGRAANLAFKGDYSKRVVDILAKKREQDRLAAGSSCAPPSPNHGALDDNSSSSHTLIDTLLLIDRQVDLITPFVTQLTYEGLIDELFGVTNGCVHLPKERFAGSVTNVSQAQQETAPHDDSPVKEIHLTSSDELFAELRNLHFNAVGPALKKRITAISEKMEERHTRTTVREYKEFVKRLPELLAARQSASIHTTIAEIIKECTTEDRFTEVLQAEQELLNGFEADRPLPALENWIAQGLPLSKILRLVCLHSLQCDGLKSKVLDHYRKDILESYGYEEAVTLLNLRKAGLLKEKSSSEPTSFFGSQKQSSSAGQLSFASVRKAFRLLLDDVNELNPSDVAYVYSGYAPLSVRLCQYLIRPGWNAIADTLNRIPGATCLPESQAEYAAPSENSVRWRPADSGNDNLDGDDEEGRGRRKRLVVVVFVGGVTNAEISALRFLSAKDDDYSFLMATTSIINGHSFLKPLIGTSP